MPQLHVGGRGPTPELPLDEVAAAIAIERPVATLRRPRRRPPLPTRQLALPLVDPLQRPARATH